MAGMQTKTITPREAAQWLSSGEAILIDVREPREFRAERIAGATSMPLASVPGAFKQMQIPAGRKVIFQCLRGGRSAQACRVAAQAAAPHPVYNLTGGIAAWKAAGLPVTGDAPAAPTTSILQRLRLALMPRNRVP
jgi:rhodanese-related sulfurtransferase